MFCDCTARFVSDLVGNANCCVVFFHTQAQVIVLRCLISPYFGLVPCNTYHTLRARTTPIIIPANIRNGNQVFIKPHALKKRENTNMILDMLLKELTATRSGNHVLEIPP